MTRCLFAFLLLGCQVAPVPSSSSALGEDGGDASLDSGTPDAGTCTATPPPYCAGERWLGESASHASPTMLGRWEDPGQSVLKIGEGQSGPGYRSLQTLQLDADSMLSFMLNGRNVIKIQDHQVGFLMHFSEVPRLWFGNTLRETAELHYQGASLGNGEARGELLSIAGQGVNGTATATSVVGGDVLLRAGDASSAQSIPLDPGEVIIGGGRVAGQTRGNVALHDAPADWCGMEGGIFVRDSRNAPQGDPSSGGFLYAAGGALYWHGSAGTVTQIATP